MLLVRGLAYQGVQGPPLLASTGPSQGHWAQQVLVCGLNHVAELRVHLCSLPHVLLIYGLLVLKRFKEHPRAVFFAIRELWRIW